MGHMTLKEGSRRAIFEKPSTLFLIKYFCEENRINHVFFYVSVVSWF